VVLDKLDYGPGILPFKLGPTKIISHYHSFLYTIDLNDIHSKVLSVKSQLNEFRPNLNNLTLSLYDPHMFYLNSKLDKLFEQIQSFQHARVKRGLVDGLGSIIKSISGNLDYTDALKYNNALKVLQTNQNKLEIELNNHVSLGKTWVSKYSSILDNIISNQLRINNTINNILKSENALQSDLIKFAHLAQHLLILTDNIEILSQELYSLDNILAFIRAKSMTHYSINISMLKEMLLKLKLLYSGNEVIDIDLRNYYEILKSGSFYVEDRLIIIFKVPIAFPKNYTLYKLSLVPNIHHQICLPTLPFIAIQRTDSMYIEAECPKLSKWYLCEDKLQYRIRDEQDCVHHLIVQQQVSTSCKFTTVNLTRAALEKLDDQNYVITLPSPTKVHISCGQEEVKTLQGSYQVSMPINCILKTPEFTISNSQNHLKGHTIKIAELPIEDTTKEKPHPVLRLNSINLEHLHEANTKLSLQHPIELENLHEDIGLYHTTIPMYSILLVICIVSVIWITYRLIRRKSYQKRSVKTENQILSDGNYSEIENTKEVSPKQVTVIRSSIPPTFSMKSSNSCRSSGGGVTQLHST
jgi:hypothetical protein